MDNHEKEEDSHEETMVLEIETTSNMAQMDFKVNDSNLNSSHSYDDLQFSYDELYDGLMNFEKTNLDCLKNISSIENQIMSLKNEYDFLKEEICLKCETSTTYENCIDLQNEVEHLSFKFAKIKDFTCLHSMFVN